MKEIHQIYDKAFKRILTLSDKAVINLINGLFGTDYPTNSKITYNWTEDEEIVFRVFEYGFGHAYKNRTIISGGEQMVFPRPCIVYLDEGKKERIPDEYTLVLKFEDQGEFFYKVPVFKLQSISIQELNDKKLIALLPFLLLKLRKKMEKIRSKENMEELQRNVVDDIMNNIDRNVEVGNISSTDAMDLKALTSMLYMRIYSKYQEMEEFTMRLYDQSLELPSDKYEKTVEELQDEVKEIRNENEELKEIIRGLEQQLKEAKEGV